MFPGFTVIQLNRLKAHPWSELSLETITSSQFDNLSWLNGDLK